MTYAFVQLRAVLPYHALTEISALALFMAFFEQSFRQIEDYSRRVYILIPCEIDDLFPVCLTDIRSVYDCELKVFQSFFGSVI